MDDQIIKDITAEIDNAFTPEGAAEIGMLTIKTANQTVEDAAMRPDPDQLYHELWYEGEVCCLFADSNLGKSIYAVQMADEISQTRNVLYVDCELSDEVGRCDHESACGYHYTPSDYFRDHPDAKPGHDWRELTAEERIRLLSKPKPQTPICTIPEAIVTRSVRPEIHSNLTLYLSTILDPVVLEGVIFLYRLGVTKDRETIFFQIDAQGRCRTGKIMKYNPSTGHRIKEENVPSKINWVHSLLKARGNIPSSWTLTQCLFGEHLLPQYPQRKVALVESEKTAVICAALMPSYIWLATGGKTQLGDKLSVLAGREVIAFPDVDGYDEWKKKLSTSGSLNIRISDYLEKNATPEDREAHIDIADLLLRRNCQNPRSETAPQKPENTILKYFALEHREQVQLLIDELNLVPVSITKINKKA